MGFTATFVLIFLVAFVLLGGLVMYLSKTIEHGEARFDTKGNVIRETSETDPEDIKPATRIGGRSEPTKIKAKNDE